LAAIPKGRSPPPHVLLHNLAPFNQACPVSLPPNLSEGYYENRLISAPEKHVLVRQCLLWIDCTPTAVLAPYLGQTRRIGAPKLGRYCGRILRQGEPDQSRFTSDAKIPPRSNFEFHLIQMIATAFVEVAILHGSPNA
jgi:hypothetical protein